MPLGIMVLIASPLMAIVLGLASLRRIDQSGGQLRGRGLAIGAIAIGALSLLIVPLLMVVLWVGFAPSSSVSIRTGAGGAGGQGGVVVQDAEVDDNAEVEDPAAISPPASMAGAGGAGGAGGRGGTAGGAGTSGTKINSKAAATPSKKDTNEF